MKLIAALAAAVMAQNEDYDRKFSDDAEWMADVSPPNYHNKSPAERYAQMECRVDQYFSKWYAAESEDEVRYAKQDRVDKNLRKLWGHLLSDMKKSFEVCADDSIDKYEPHGKECNYVKWLDYSFRKSLHEMVSWAGEFVRKNIYTSNQKRRCEPNGVRLFKRIDRLNAYFQWQYCDKFDNTVKPCIKWIYETPTKQAYSPRNITAHEDMEDFVHVPKKDRDQ